ncbi:AGL045Wp [Eremothecium gossypii ATCC 10895]|uniref:tRNA wybutosine-synthesizing protein 3 n=1 Tax=Eremothecium gossypii (strain ATCC 10895 / CBS 109.51 / FGSC 9923 / NRRL Y-1056) TaxID=284811 RepID=Q750J6_EREGS|nr:AGL045Wp [Eremothecium gossypii ATCC 10895]AAS54445.1 AGL045Wp [Eremothecium gossypii ATCC 10895]AEY98777.1 FAGL045Wp [Eremothecium gossypii FDAG1]
MSQNGFDQKKKSILSGINSEGPDLSPKGDIDSLCIPIIELINSHKDMVTTSSCSGRVSVFVEGRKAGSKPGGKGEGGRWLFVSHDKELVRGWRAAHDLDWDAARAGDGDSNGRFMLYKFEPFILHVKCRDFAAAARLLRVAMACGFRESGIGSNNLVGIRISIKLDVPIGRLDESTDRLRMFVSPEYVDLLDELAVGKFMENERKMQELYEAIDEEIIRGLPVPVTSKDDDKARRRERKRREGLERQRQLQEAAREDIL